MELGEPDDSGRRRPVPVPGSEFEIAVRDGRRGDRDPGEPGPDPTAPDLAVNQWGYIVTDENGMTRSPGIFAGGDIVRGAATVILAMGDGKRAAWRSTTTSAANPWRWPPSRRPSGHLPRSRLRPPSRQRQAAAPEPAA